MNEKIIALIDKLAQNRILSKSEFVFLIDGINDAESKYLFKKSLETKQRIYGNDIYIRALIELTNYCKNDCYYCGIRCSNKNIKRYRLSEAEILECCKRGYELGFRTFVLQGGEDPFFTDEVLVPIVEKIATKYPDCALTLSLGERKSESYKALFNAGAQRYLLRFETSQSEHYSQLHPARLSLKNRLDCLQSLKQIGYQFGTGFMVESPGQSTKNLASDLLLLHELQPHMVGIGPFVPQSDTPLGKHSSGTLNKTLVLLACIRLMLPHALIPATTALATIDQNGRQKGILAGANVLMPNMSPQSARENYKLYDNKAHTAFENANAIDELKKEIAKIGAKIVVAKGDTKFE